MRAEKVIKTGWHVFLAAAAVAEMTTAKSTFRKLLLGGCAGWHAAAIWVDLTDEEETSDSDHQ